jgi:hypothetical protein
LSLFLAREVRSTAGVVIDRVRAPPGGFAITARDGRKQAEGRIELVFAGAPLSSAEWL